MNLLTLLGVVIAVISAYAFSVGRVQAYLHSRDDFHGENCSFRRGIGRCENRHYDCCWGELGLVWPLYLIFLAVAMPIRIAYRRGRHNIADGKRKEA